MPGEGGRGTHIGRYYEDVPLQDIGLNRTFKFQRFTFLSTFSNARDPFLFLLQDQFLPIWAKILAPETPFLANFLSVSEAILLKLGRRIPTQILIEYLPQGTAR